MKNNKRWKAMAAMAFCISGIYSQDLTVAAGGEASGSGGTISYTIGQVAFGTITGSGISVVEGIQQPYEILVITGVPQAPVSLIMSTYPNPVTDLLILKISENEPFVNKYTATLYDLDGRQIKDWNITGSETKIDFKNLKPSAYLLKIASGNKEIKTFKIIKNR